MESNELWGVFIKETLRKEVVLEGKVGRPMPWGSQQGPGLCMCARVCRGVRMCTHAHVCAWGNSECCRSGYPACIYSLDTQFFSHQLTNKC